MLMLGEVWLGDVTNSYLYIGPNIDRAKDVANEFRLLIGRECGLSCTRGDQVVLLETGQRFIFAAINPEHNLDCALTGNCFHKIFVDISDEVRAHVSPRTFCYIKAATIFPTDTRGGDTLMLHGPGIALKFDVIMWGYTNETLRDGLTTDQVTTATDNINQFKHTVRCGSMSEFNEWYELYKDVVSPTRKRKGRKYDWRTAATATTV